MSYNSGVVALAAVLAGCGTAEPSASPPTTVVTSSSAASAPTKGFRIILAIEAAKGAEFSVSGDSVSEKEFSAPGELVIGFPRRIMDLPQMSHAWEAPTSDLDVVVDLRKAGRAGVQASCSISVTDPTGKESIYSDDNGAGDQTPTMIQCNTSRTPGLAPK